MPMWLLSVRLKYTYMKLSLLHKHACSDERADPCFAVHAIGVLRLEASHFLNHARVEGKPGVLTFASKQYFQLFASVSISHSRST